MKFIKRNCKNCNKLFDAPLREVNRGNGKFCSRKCSSGYRKGKEITVKVPNTSCAKCEKVFYVRPSRAKSSKSGLNFCSRECKDSAQRIGGIKEIMPPHYGTGSGLSGSTGYRAKAFKELPIECFDCGWSEIPEVLVVHHIDCNRTNNDLSNLMILCGRCHDIKHFETKTGKWSNT